MTFDPFANAPQPVDSPADNQAVDTTDDMNQFIRTLSDAGWNDAPPVEPEPEEEVEDETDDSQPAPSTVPTVAIGERQVPLSEVTALYELGKAIKDGNLIPQKQEESTPDYEPPTFEPLPAPTYIDKENEVEVGLWNALQESNREIHEIKATVGQIQQGYNQSRTEQFVNQGVAEFRAEHPSFSEDEINTIRLTAGPLASSFVAVSATPVEGIKRAMYHAAIDNSALRDRILHPDTKPKASTSDSRKKKLGSLSPSGSAPRTGQSQARPTSDRDAVNEFGKQLAESFGTNGRLN